MTPKFQLTVRAVAAAALALAVSFQAVPALAEAGGPEPAPATSPWAGSSPAASSPASSSPAGPVDSTTAGGSASAGGAAATDPAAAPAVDPEISDAGLAEAVRRDLGMTLEEFNAAGQLARTAADALPSLRELPGYAGITLRDRKILVAGAGPELQTRVDELNAAGSAGVSAAVFVLTPPASPAPAAPSAADLVASSTEQLFQAYVREVGPAGLQAVAYSGGSFVIRTGGTNTAEAQLPAVPAPDQQTAPPADPAASAAPALAAAPTAAAAEPGKVSPADFVARYANVQLEQGTPAQTEQDIFGGQGVVTDFSVCSAGFGAYGPGGVPLLLTAGHCTYDGTARETHVEDPSTSQAAGATPTWPFVTAGTIGTFGFSQFGGPQNSWVLDSRWETGDPGEPGNVGTDIALIEGIRPDLALQPAASTWRGSAPDYSTADPINPAPTAVRIIGMVTPFQGQEVCLSGRTTGWSCGRVDEVGIYVAGGKTYPRNSRDVRAFKGFRSNTVESSGGDSGGPWISGNFAVGTHSAGEERGGPEKFAVATTLADSLTHIPTPVQLQLFLNKPELVAPDNLTFMAGQPITGRVAAAPASAVAANSKVVISVGNQTVEAPVDAAGNWTYPAPEASGPLTFTAETANGFSRSGAVTLAVTVTNLDAPVITTPPEGAALKSVSRIDGTGTPGLTVKLSGDISGSALVGPDGRWTIPVEGPAAGRLSIHAVQMSPGEKDSASVTRNFTVAPASPAITTIVDGSHLSQGALPGTISGTGVANADVAVLIDGVSAGAARAGANGSWSVPFPAGLTPGEHTLSATQSVDGVASDPLLLTFTVDAPAVAPVEFVPPVEPDAPAAPGIPAAQPVVLPAGSGQLPDTGAGTLVPLAGLAGGSLLLGGVLLGGAAVRRRATN